LRNDLRDALLLQDSGPVELDVRITLFNRSNGDLVECGPSDLDARWSAKPVENSGSRSASPAIAVDDEGVFVAAFVATEPQVRQGYFLFCARAAFAAGRA